MSSNNSNSSVRNGARYSAINTKHQCELWAWLIYREKIDGYQNPFAKLGIAIHDLLELYGKHCLENKLETDHTFLDLIKPKCFTVLGEGQIGDATKIVEKIKDSINWIEYLDNKNVFLEKRLYINKNMEPCQEDDAFFSSGIDVIAINGNEAFVEDYKTVRVIYGKQYMEESLQRKLYSMMVLKHFPEVDIVGFSFNFVRYGYRSAPLFVYREELPELENTLRVEIEALNDVLANSQAPKPNPGSHCILCEGRALCSAYRNAFDPSQRISNAEDAVELYKQYKIGKIRLEATEDLLKEWINNNSPITIRHDEYGPVPENSIKYNDINKLVQILTASGVPIGAIYDSVTINQASIKKLISRFKLKEATKASIDAIATKGVIIKFKTKQIESNETEEMTEVDPYI